MNKHLAIMKDAIGSYAKAQKTAEEKRVKVNDTYLPDVAARELAIIQVDLAAKRKEALQQIENAYSNAKTEVEDWGKLDGNKINDADLKLLQLDLSPEEFSEVCARNRSNGTMCSILMKHANEHNAALREKHKGELFPFGIYDTEAIPSVQSKAAKWDAIYKGATNMINSLGSADPYTRSAVEKAVPTWGDNVVLE